MRSNQFSALDTPLIPGAKIPVPPAGSANAPELGSYVVYAGPLACGGEPGAGGGGPTPTGGGGGGRYFGYGSIGGTGGTPGGIHDGLPGGGPESFGGGWTYGG